jgi:hypothetical protein
MPAVALRNRWLLHTFLRRVMNRAARELTEPPDQRTRQVAVGTHLGSPH